MCSHSHVLRFLTVSAAVYGNLSGFQFYLVLSLPCPSLLGSVAVLDRMKLKGTTKLDLTAQPFCVDFLLVLIF